MAVCPITQPAIALVAKMYLNHFNFKTKPFTLSTDPSFLWVGASQRQALTTLSYGLQENKGIVVLGGEFGTGKTTLVNAFVKALADDILAAQVPEPGTDLVELLQRIAIKFGIRDKFGNLGDLAKALHSLVDDPAGQKRRLLLIIDEAQGLTAGMQEEVFRLARLDYKGSRLVHILLVGQNEVYQWFTGTTREAFIKELSAACKLHLLNKQETTAYIDHRLQVAGATRSPFTKDAISTIHEVSHGVPRTINLMCDFSLLHAHLENSDQVESRMVETCKNHFQITSTPETKTSEVVVRDIAPLPTEPETLRRHRVWRNPQLQVLFLLLLIIGGGYLYYDDRSHNQIPQENPTLMSLSMPKSLSPPQREVQSALIKGHAEIETLQNTIAQLPMDQPSKDELHSPLKMPSSPTETAEDAHSDVMPIVAVDSDSRVKKEADLFPITEDTIHPPVVVKPQIVSPTPSHADIETEPERPAPKTLIQTDTDPGDIIDWLIQQKKKSEDSTSQSPNEVSP